MPSPFTCGHTCSDCTYTCERKRDMDKHELTNRAHRFCNEICPRHGHLNNPTIRVLTPETLSARLEAPPNSLSASPSRSNTPSASSTSSRKRAREPSPEEDAEERLKRMKQEGRVLIETLKICCVLDPSRAARNYQEIESHSCWVEVELPGKEVNQLITSGELSGFVFRVPKYANNVRLYDWAYIAYSCFREEGYSVVFKTWEELSQLIVNEGSHSAVRKLRDEGFDCVFGGIDLSIRPPSTVVGSIENREREALVALASVFPVFPSPQGCMDHGAKVAFNRRLDDISKTMQMRRPKTKAVVDATNPPHDMVLKREFSDAGRDVFIPDPKLSERGRLRQAAKFIKERTAANPKDKSLWLAQEFVPFLSIGEVRFMCVDGSPIREVLTGKNPANHPENPGALWSSEGCDHLKTVSELQKVVDEGKELTESSAFNANRGTADKQVAKDKLYGFVKKFVDHLAADKGKDSSLHVFCRVDASVFVDEEEKVSLFVNEVERGITTCLWAGAGSGVVGHVGTDMALPLAHWIVAEKRKLGIQ